jgi:hypothetical protein
VASARVRKIVVQNENKSAAERMVNTVLAYKDHMVHNRPGILVPDPSAVIGVRWYPATHAEKDGKKIVYRCDKVGKKVTKTEIGQLWADGTIRDANRRKLADYQPAGIFGPVVVWTYKQIAEIFKLDNEFAARWASYAYLNEDSRDLKNVLAAFMLVQNRAGLPVKGEDGKVEFFDDDYRDVAEAMMLIYDGKSGGKANGGKKGRAKPTPVLAAPPAPTRGTALRPKDLYRIREILCLPEVAKINFELGFAQSDKKPYLGRWEATARKWLRYREQNPRLLEGLIKDGYRKLVMALVRLSYYKPTTEKFFEVLRWKQAQAKDGHRQHAIGKAVKAAETWEGLTEEQICQKIVSEKVGYKRLISLVPVKIGITKAILAAAVQAGCLSDKDLIIATPTLEEMGLLQDADVKARWEQAMKAATDMRAANIARNVKSKETQEKLQETAEAAAQKVVAKEAKNMRLYVVVDRSGSMQGAIEKAIEYIAKFLPSFPLDRLHVSVFNSESKLIVPKAATKAGVEHAFRGIAAGGGTDHAEGIRAFRNCLPNPDEDVLIVFVGDQAEAGTFERVFDVVPLRPNAFAMLTVARGGTIVFDTAARLRIPCFEINERIFQDPYAIPETIRTIMAATPVGQAVQNRVAPPRESLVDRIMKTDLLQPPAWAA